MTPNLVSYRSGYTETGRWAMSRRKKNNKKQDIPKNPNGSSRIQPVSRQKGFKKLRAMKCFSEVHDRICKGWSLQKVVDYIQVEREEYTDVTNGSLKCMLQNYRDSLPAGVRAQHVLPKAHIDAIYQIEKDIDEVAELIKLYRRQESRLDIDGDVEKNIGKLLPTMTQEIRVTTEVLRAIANIKMDLGTYERKLGTVDVEATLVEGIKAKYDNTEVGSVLTDPKKRRRLLNIAEHAISLSKRGVSTESISIEEPKGELVTSDD